MQPSANRSGVSHSLRLNITSVSVGPTYITAMQLRLRLWKLLQVYFYPSHIREIPSDITSITPDASHQFCHASTQFDNHIRPTFVPLRSSSWYINGKYRRAVHTWQVCAGACAYRLICATSAQPAQGCSPFEKWVTLPDDVKSPSASPARGALPKPPHPIPRPYNGKYFSKAFIKHLPRISQFLKLNTRITLQRRKLNQRMKKFNPFFKQAQK